MRILFLHTEREWSGCARIFAAAARGLGTRGHQVTMVCTADCTVQERLSREGSEVVVLPPDGTVAGDAWRLRSILQERFIEAVFVHSEREQLAVASAMRLAERGAVFRRVPEGEPFNVKGSGRLAGRVAATGVVFASKAERERAKEHLGGFSLGAVVASTGVDVMHYDQVKPVARQSVGAPNQSRLIACVYDPSSRPRLTTVLRTMAILAPRHPELHLAIVGPGSDHEDVRMHAAALGINNVVSHLGERDDHLAVLASAEVGWVAADHDDAALGFLDLMALRVPIVAERSPIAERYVADGIVGCLIQPGDPSETAAAVAAFLARDEQRTTMGNAGRTRVAREFAEAPLIDGFERAVQAAGDRTAWAVR
jgi:glycosyltransferase involved in cell wall biosynthesis